MLAEAEKRVRILQDRMRQDNIDRAIFTDESSMAYLAGFWGYLGIEFGRPTMLIVDAEEAPVIVTPLMESEMVSAMTWVTTSSPWSGCGSVPSPWAPGSRSTPGARAVASTRPSWR